ncbi:MAG: chromate transporter [Alkalibacterium gilvum]|uniref:Chromate transporter n=1 Tax=Alkalibacterium gilvum TaxID=1130080 RepID=A0A1H6SYY5_9LACT|nr:MULTISPECIES: chromate transporter [Alkalibacterium]MDN6193944.1 chromate transporter [Alkalibacterium sp.]MDN6293896.1 chromate transporter [Alkalibacterium sp.]MDN6295859.1 chromate transporter [Alkalibacterium sp.]MDN6397952.1 chromate transporter [Alkalibacterium sp.]MDN6729157.1 chromate transporter [Alkalibacterium sp.]
MIYLNLLFSFFQIGLLSFGGGYAALPLIEQELIHNQGWITNQQFIDVLTLSEMTPGPIAINAATFSGNQIAGVLGGVVATVGVTLPSVIIVQLLAYFYFKYKNIEIVQGIIQGLRPAVVALIASAGLTIFLTAMFGQSDLPVDLSTLNYVSIIFFALGVFLMRKFKASPIHVIILTGILGGIVYSII